MRIIRVKLGTMNANRVRAMRLRSDPVAGQTFFIRSLAHGSRSQRVHCTEVRPVGGEPLYFLELM